MLGQNDRQVLMRWCRARRVRWLATLGPDRQPAVLLVADGPGWPAMRVLAERDGLLLETETGEILAAASGLQALLDAVDAGIAEVAGAAATAPVADHLPETGPEAKAVGSAIA